MSTSIWETLSTIDCSEHIEKKGQFSYLAWSWAVAMVKDKYPEMTHRPLEDAVYADGSMEVRCEVTIGDQTHPMWLPVTDHSNKAIQQPNAFDINTARMRCLVKNFAVNYGLGHYIYAGESLPMPAPEQVERYEQLLSLVANKKHWELKKFSDTNKAHMDAIFNQAPEKKKTAFKAAVREVYLQANTDLKANLAALEELVAEHSPDAIVEGWSEIVGIEREYTIAGLNEVLRKQLEEHIGDLA